MKRLLTTWFVLAAVLGLMLGTGQAWAQDISAPPAPAPAPAPAAPAPAPPPVPVSAVPEPGPLIGAGVVTLMGLGYAWLRRKQATA